MKNLSIHYFWKSIIQIAGKYMSWMFLLENNEVCQFIKFVISCHVCHVCKYVICWIDLITLHDYLSIYLSIYLYLYLYLYISISISIYLYLYLYIYMHIRIFKSHKRAPNIVYAVCCMYTIFEWNEDPSPRLRAFLVKFLELKYLDWLKMYFPAWPKVFLQTFF